jgi:hypothetical protein
MKSGEQLFNPYQRGPRTAPMSENRVTEPFVGRTTIDSGSTSVTVSTALVQADSLILKTVEVGSVGLAANSGGGIVVNSIVAGVSFAFARPTGVAVPWDDTVMWELIKSGTD